MDGVGTCILYKLDQQLFRRSTRGADQECFRERQFADDFALLATTCEGVQVASTASDFGLTVSIVSIVKTKFMVVGYDVEECDVQPISVDCGEIDEFQYLVSIIG